MLAGQPFQFIGPIDSLVPAMNNCRFSIRDSRDRVAIIDMQRWLHMVKLSYLGARPRLVNFLPLPESTHLWINRFPDVQQR